MHMHIGLWYRLRRGYYEWREWCESYSLKQRLHYKIMQLKSFFKWLFRKIDWWGVWDGNYFQLDCCVNCVKLCPECGECEGAHLEFDYTHTGFGCPHKGKTTKDEDDEADETPDDEVYRIFNINKGG